MKIIVLAGGKSSEREVSMTSGSKIANALIANGHKVLLVDLLIGVPNYYNFDSAYEEYKTDYYDYEISESIPDSAIKFKREIGENVLKICESADITYFALHGGIGENGKLQAVFDVYDIKYTGSDYQSSLLAMDKLIAKELMRFHGIPTANWSVVSDVGEIETINLPAVVKPLDCGSSVGISLVGSKNELRAAINTAHKYSDNPKILIEDKIEGREFSVGILGKQILPAIELIPKSGFYDYQNKYQKGRTEEIVPAQIDNQLAEEMGQLALKTHRTLGLAVCSRTDFLVDKDNNIFVIEVNSLPGMTPNSLLPQEAEAVGIGFNELCETIIDESIKKYECK